MRSNRGIFWYSLGLTLLLLLPMVLTVAFFTDQYQKQQLLRQASAADSTLHIEPGAQGVYTLLLVVQQEEPAFVLARADGPQQTVTLCALPGSLRVSAPSGTTTLAECALSARGRAGRTAARRHGGYGGDRRPGAALYRGHARHLGGLRGPHSLGTHRHGIAAGCRRTHAPGLRRGPHRRVYRRAGVGVDRPIAGGAARGRGGLHGPRRRLGGVPAGRTRRCWPVCPTVCAAAVPDC